MSINDLFIRTENKPSIPKIKLPSDVKMWGQFLTQKILEDWNILNGLDISIKFNVVESETGTSVATAHVINPQNRCEIFIPIIIKNFSCYPIDIMITKDGENSIAQPMNLKRIEKNLFLCPSPFKELEDPYEFNRNYLGIDNEMGGIGYAGITPPLNKMGSLLEIISQIPEEESHYLRDNILKDEKIVFNFHKNKTLHLLEKILTLPTIKNENDQLSKSYRAKILYLKKLNDDKIKLIHSPPEQFSPNSEVLSIQNLFNLYPQIKNLWESKYNELKEFGETLIEFKNSSSNKILFDSDLKDSEPKHLNTMGAVNVQSVSGEFLDGIIISEMTNLDGKKLSTKLFIGKDCYSLAESFIGNWIPKISFNLKTRELPKIKEFGCFIGTNDENLLSVTNPFQILSIEDNLYKALDTEGKVFYFRKIINLEMENKKEEYKIKKIFKKDSNTYVIPASIQFLLLDNYIQISSFYDSLRKQASVNAIHPLNLKNVGNHRYAISGVNSELACFLNES